MTTTTIKVERELRDVLKRQALSHGRTLGEHLASLAAADERRDRMDQLRRAVTENPPDADYVAEARALQDDSWT